MKKIQVWLKETSEPLSHNTINTYQKGDMFCVFTEDGMVHKYPFGNIWKVIEEYGTHGRRGVK